MRLSFFSVLLFFLPAMSIAQEYSLLTNQDTTLKDAVYSNFQIDLNSNGLTNEFINAYYQGSFISQEIKNRSLANLGKMNILGDFQKSELAWVHTLSNIDNPSDVFIKVDQYSINEMKFADDLFKLVFYGNNDFIEKMARFSNSGYQSFQYLQCKVGFSYRFPEKSGLHQFQIALGLNLGQNHNKIQVNTGDFYTQTHGEHIYLGLDAQIQQTDTNRKSFFDFNGWGPNIDLSYQYQFKHKNTLGIAIENLGYVEWNPNSFSKHCDTAIHFRGIEVNDAFHIPVDLFGNKLDSLKNELAYNQHTTQYITYTPAKIKLFYYQAFLHNSLHLNIETGYTLFSYQKPYIYLQAAWQASPHFFIAPLIKYGGYGKLNLGASVGINHWKNFNLMLYTQYINGLISPSTVSGEGVGLTLSKRF